MTTTMDPRTDVDNPAALPELSPHAELALMARALDRFGYSDPAVGHVTYRHEDHFLTLPRELGWDEVRASHVLQMDEDGNKLAGNPHLSVPKAILLHLELHRFRPSCNVTLHQHPTYATAYSALGRIPKAYDQRSTLADADNVILYDDYLGPVTGQASATDAARAMGTAHTALLRNHGVLVTGDDIVQTFTRAAYLEWRCRKAWIVEAVGDGREMPPDGRAAILDGFYSIGARSTYMWEWAVRRELRFDPSVLG